MRTLTPLALSLVLALLTLPAPPAGAGELKGVTLPDTVDVGGQSLQLNGMALRKKFFISVYVAGLYLPEKQSDAEEVLASDTARRMVMHWLRGVGQDKICEGWMEGLDNNTENPSEQLKKDFETLCQWTGSAEEGDRYVFTYVPGEGTKVEVAGQTKGTLEGKAFADALFASWIGPNPGPGEGFKSDLMGG
jgi:hypothetical protein